MEKYSSSTRLAPGFDIVAAANQIDERHSRATGPTQNLHFKFVFGAVRPGTIHYVKNAGAFDDRPKQLAFVVKPGIVGMFFDESRDQLRTLAGTARTRLQPVQHRPRALKPGGIHQHVPGLVHGASGVAVSAASGPERGADENALVLRQGGHDAAFTLVGVPHHGEGGNHDTASIT